ncbi:hypothetical protein B0H17DRAFT_1219661 [Mycena rosella]|uniref:DUF6589 domain-containing protein n=1 Tax=Mycena rosella TaxID=1033263 RepID=A0AAD7BG05_MYCRO|nr:hypothetical protein B0H17DRAFT_1219661 [Mycena rosella]
MGRTIHTPLPELIHLVRDERDDDVQPGRTILGGCASHHPPHTLDFQLTLNPHPSPSSQRKPHSLESPRIPPRRGADKISISIRLPPTTKAPSNMKKVEFYPGSQLLYLVLDGRMLDCWRLLLGAKDIFTHFDELAEAKRLPNFDDLVSNPRSFA